MTDRFWSSDDYDERANSLYNEGDVDGALEMLREGLALYPNAVELYVGLGHARLAREEFAWARAAFERALVLDPGHEDAMVGMGEVLLRLGRREEGLARFREVEALGYEDDVELMLTMGRALYREALYVQAKRVFMRLVACRPDCADAIASVGYAVHRMGDEVEAGRYLRRALRQDPDLHEARTYLGHILYDRGDWVGALREFERIPPPEHWDPLAVWRILELREAAGHDPQRDPLRRVWTERLAQLEALEWDPVEELLAEIEAKVSDEEGLAIRDREQLELFPGERNREVRIVRLPGGLIVRGTAPELVRQLRDSQGFSHEGLVAFMRRMAERWLEQEGVEVPWSDPASFLRAADRGGLLHLHGPDDPTPG